MSFVAKPITYPADRKSARKTASPKKRPQDKSKKRPRDASKKRPDIINPVSLDGVVSECELRTLLKAKRQYAWCSRVRVGGLLMLIDTLRNRKSGLMSVSADTARSYVSKLRDSCASGATKEPLPLLCQIGILELVRPGVHAHIHASAVYRFGEKYENQLMQLRVPLTPKLASKLQNADQRCQKRLNQKFPYREQLLKDLSAISFAQAARQLIAKMLAGDDRDNVGRLVSAIDGKDHYIRTSERGQITTSISNCSEELRRLLLLRGESTVECDVSHAHWNFLPRILTDRLRHCSNAANRQKYISDGWREHDRLTVLLSDGDFYRAWCKDPKDDKEREQKKQILNILIHSKNDRGEQNGLYQRLKSEFPISFAIVEDIKSEDHRNLGKQLHRFIADAIEAALLELQRQGIAAIPLVDALICQQKNHAAVCEALGRQIFLAAGVCAKVGGIRYSPLTEEEEAVLAFDEEAATNDGMSYDEWEAVRVIRCVAALKLLRRCPPLFFASCAGDLPIGMNEETIDNAAVNVPLIKLPHAPKSFHQGPLASSIR